MRKSDNLRGMCAGVSQKSRIPLSNDPAACRGFKLLRADFANEPQKALPPPELPSCCCCSGEIGILRKVALLRRIERRGYIVASKGVLQKRCGIYREKDSFLNSRSVQAPEIRPSDFSGIPTDRYIRALFLSFSILYIIYYSESKILM